MKPRKSDIDKTRIGENLKKMYKLKKNKKNIKHPHTNRWIKHSKGKYTHYFNSTLTVDVNKK